jgi:hypothetical protein
MKKEMKMIKRKLVDLYVSGYAVYMTKKSMKPRLLALFKLPDPWMNNMTRTTEWIYLRKKYANFQAMDAFGLIIFMIMKSLSTSSVLFSLINFKHVKDVNRSARITK